MSWKENLHTVNAGLNRVSRSTAEGADASAREVWSLEPGRGLLDAKQRVADYENYINRIQSLHLQAPMIVDWKSLANQLAPKNPDLTAVRTQSAKNQVANFQPTIVHKILGTEGKARSRLEKFLDSAIQLEKAELKAKIEKYKLDLAHWKSLTKLAKAVIRRDRESYLEAVNRLPIFEDIINLGSNIVITKDSHFSIKAELSVNGRDVIPDQEYTLREGDKFSSKPMRKTKHHELYQDYVCSALIRIARELFALLPIDEVVVTAIDDNLDNSTGRLQHSAIVSAKLDREQFESLDFDRIDPSCALSNFQTNMSFNPRLGFEPIAVLS